MTKFQIESTRTDEYIIEIDDTIWTPEYLEEWGNTFFQFDDLQQLAEHIFFSLMRSGTEQFYEGFGHLETYRHGGQKLRQFTGFKEVTDFCEGIKVTVVTEDDDYDYSVKYAAAPDQEAGKDENEH